jgi:preprotein translocase subunit YajC
MIGWEMIIQVLAVCGVLAAAYYALVRPQLQSQTDHLNFIASLKLGDQIVTRGGLVGEIVHMDDGAVLGIELCKSVRVRVLKNSIEERLEVSPAAGHAQINF